MRDSSERASASPSSSEACSEEEKTPELGPEPGRPRRRGIRDLHKVWRLEASFLFFKVFGCTFFYSFLPCWKQRVCQNKTVVSYWFWFVFSQFPVLKLTWWALR